MNLGPSKPALRLFRPMRDKSSDLSYLVTEGWAWRLD
jgi:hypothetical protein